MPAHLSQIKIKKASLWTPFVFLFAVFSFQSVFAECQPPGTLDKDTVEKIYDGDTIKLVNGKKLRLIGINTPERGRNNQPDEPFYLEAKQALRKIIVQNNNEIYIKYGKDKFDRHGRLLGHLFTQENINIAEILIQRGLGYYLAIPPNTHFLECLKQAETKAIKTKSGLWASPSGKRTDISQLNKKARGFYLVTGKVQRIGESRSSFWLNLNRKDQDRFALRILKKDLENFKSWHPRELLNKTVTARGWIYIANQEQRINIRHPDSIKIH